MAAAAVPAVPTLPLRADVLLSSALFEELDDGLSAEVLRHRIGREDLEEVDFAELQVDAVSGAQRVESIGELLPSLQQLRLNQSLIYTIRDLGTSLRRLRVLWLCRSSLRDLGGVTAMPALEELYVSFNDINELSPLCTHESLQVLDLEGNLVTDFDAVRALQDVSSLRELNLSLNPLWRQGVSRQHVLEALPQLEMLDDAPRSGATAGRSETWDAELLEEPSSPTAEDLLADWPPPQAEPPAEEPLASLPPSGAAEDSQALRRLRERASTGWRASPTAAGAAAAAPCIAFGEKGGLCSPIGGVGAPAVRLAPLTEPPGGGDGSAVAALHAERVRLRTAAAEGRCQDEPSQAEPSEHELLVERLKRAARPPPGATWRLGSTSARPADGGRRPPTGLFPDRRPLTAWSSGRPTTASSGTGAASSRSGMHAESEAASDLTTGDDGAPLAGNPLAAARRRRRAAAAQGEDELSIWNLLRRSEAEADALESSQYRLEGFEPERLATPDVRIGPARLLTSGGGRGGGARTPAARTAARPAEGADSVPAPSVATGTTEVLYLE